MKTMNVTPIVAVEYSKEAFAAKMKKAVSKFIDTYLVFTQKLSGMTSPLGWFPPQANRSGAIGNL